MTYKKDGVELEESDQFLYLEEIYLLSKKCWELYKSRTYSSKNLIEKQNSRAYNEEHKCHIFRYWELVAAPKQYLESNGFILKV